MEIQTGGRERSLHEVGCLWLYGFNGLMDAHGDLRGSLHVSYSDMVDVSSPLPQASLATHQPRDPRLASAMVRSTRAQAFPICTPPSASSHFCRSRLFIVRRPSESLDQHAIPPAVHGVVAPTALHRGRDVGIHGIHVVIRTKPIRAICHVSRASQAWVQISTSGANPNTQPPPPV
jgi:hypothetical protein